MIEISKRILGIQPYKITAQDVWTTDPRDVLKADWNEAPFNFDIYDYPLKKILEHPSILAWYPDYLCLDLIESIVSRIGCEANEISVHSGSDSALCDITNVFLNESDVVLCVSPTYDNFRVYAQQNGGVLKDFSLNSNGHLDLEGLSEAIASVKPKIVYIVNPNNPYGTVSRPELLLRVIANWPEVLFIIDEAYIEFAIEFSISKFATNYPNIVVSRTFSKAYGLAGLRVGYIIANKRIIHEISKIRKGKNVSMIGQILAAHALKNQEYFDNWVDTVGLSKLEIYDFLDKNKIKHIKSEANFVLIFASKPTELCAAMKSCSVLVRDRSSVIPGSVRITVGNLESAKRVVALLNDKIEFLK